MSIIPKKYDPSFEKEMYASWMEKGYFSPSADSSGEPFVIPLPPPNVTGELHLGHSVMLAVEDAMARYARLQGKRVLWIPGTDHAGIATQVVVERNLRRDAKKTKDDIGRVEFLDEVWKWVRKSRSKITGQIQQMWSSVDRSREEFTMSEQLSRAVRKAFVDLYANKKVYRDTYMVNRSPEAKTVLSDLEVEHKQVTTKLYYIKYFVQGKGESLTVATVRPETMFGDVAVAVHPKDRRYKKWIGKNVLIPIVNKQIPIIADETVSMEFGTGVLKITPSHSEEDFLIARKHELPVEKYAIDKENNYTEHAGEELEGKQAYDFMDNLIQLLDEIGNLEKVVDYETTIPYCERTWCRVQPLLSQQWFFDVQQAADQVQTHIDNKDVAVHPEKFEKQFTQWLEKIRPWCISRQLWWWHRIPVRYDEAGNQFAFDEDGAVGTDDPSSILSKIVFNLVADSRLPNPFTLEQLIDILLQQSLTPQRGRLRQIYLEIYRTKYAGKKDMLAYLDKIETVFSSVDNQWADMQAAGEWLIDLLEQAPQIVPHRDTYRFIYLQDGKEISLTQDEDVLDTWFSSGLRPFSVLGWPENTTDLQDFYPATVLETGYDIIFFRVIRMMLMGVSLTGQMPFKNVYLHGLVRAQDGQKMSKSKGNGVDPLEMVEKYGADALRGALILGNTPGNDQKFAEQKVEYVWKFINKLWNATRFVQTQLGASDEGSRVYSQVVALLEDEKKQLSEYDIWIMNKCNDVIAMTGKYHDKFMLGEALQETISFVWHDFCDRYVEIVKGNHSALTPSVLIYVLGTACILLHPACPFVSEQLWKFLGFEGSLMQASRPTPVDVGQKNYRFNLLMDMITQRRALRQEVAKQAHEDVTLLVQGNRDIHLLLEEHSELVKKILHASEIIVLTEQDPLPNDFQISLLLDIKLGVRGVVTKDRKTVVSELEKEVIQEEQFLQRIRAQLSSNDFLGKAPPAVVDEKKQKMLEVKTKIVTLQHEIQRLKMEHK
jgi:valyl-tRNA synthetase